MDKHTDTAEYWKSKFIQQNKDLGCEQMDPNGTIWDHAKKLQEENERLREALDRLMRVVQAQTDLNQGRPDVIKQCEEALERKSHE
jgi:predicted transcriptional regulator